MMLVPMAKDLIAAHRWVSLALTLGAFFVCVSAAAAETETEAGGPTFELDGLDDGELPATELSGNTAPSEVDEGDVFSGRTDKDATLFERAASIVDRTTIGGYGQHEFIAGEGVPSRFRNHRWVLFVYSQITDRISTATEIEFEYAGSPLKKDGVMGFGEVLLEFSVLDFEIYEWLVLRVGVILTPVGSFNVRHDSPTRDLVDRPIAYTTIVPTTWFESGVGFHGKLQLPGNQRLNYELYLINGLDARIRDGSGFRGARGSHFEDNNNDKAFTGRLGWSPFLGLEIGVSGYTGEYDLRGNRANMANLDVMWRYAGFELLGEAVFATIDAGFVEGFSASSAANSRDPVPTTMWGFFLQANYHFTIGPLWGVFPEWLQEAVMTVVLRYGGLDTDTERMSSAGDRRRLTLGLNFRPLEAVVFKFDLQWNHSGVDGKRVARDPWHPGFWKKRNAGFLPDRFVGSVAYLF